MWPSLTVPHPPAVGGHVATVRYLAYRGCSLTRTDDECECDALGFARLHQGDGTTDEVIRLLEDVGSAGGWRQYVAARRMPYLLIRHAVSLAGTVLPKTKKLRKLRALYHFVFGKGADLQTAPTDVFGRVIGFLV